MSRPKLSARPRELRGKAVARLRQSGSLPGVVYGGGQDSQLIEVDAHEFELLHRETGRHAVLDLQVEGNGKPQPVLLQAIQEHPVSRKPLHVDLLVVNLQEERTVDAPIVMIGESEAVNKMGGVLLHLRDAVVVRAKPDDLPSGIELDVTPLDSFEAVLHASDLRIPDGVTMVTDPTEPIARVQPPRVEEEPVAAEPGEGVEGEAGAEAAEAEDGQAASGDVASAETGGEESS